MGTAGHQIPGNGKAVPDQKGSEPVIRTVIPIIFLPGIAGTNLKIKPGLEQVLRKSIGLPDNSPPPDPWRPPGKNIMALALIDKWNDYNPAQRQQLLNMNNTCVDSEGFLEAGKEGLVYSPFTQHGRSFRGWNSIHALSYEKFLQSMEREFNTLRYPFRIMNNHPNNDYAISHLFRLLMPGRYSKKRHKRLLKMGLGHCRLSREEIFKVFNFSLPVYAVGYNWLDSNKKSAEKVIEILEKIKSLYNDNNNSNSNYIFECKQFILVTHSMGGLVARAAAAMDKAQMIYKIVHIAMPAVGAPSAYRRMVAGVELEVPENSFLAKKGNAAAILMGVNTALTTPVMANSPGCLQLLPTGGYPNGWLTIVGDNGNQHQTGWNLPYVDPYCEIYKQKNAWFRLVDQKFLDPAKINSKIIGFSCWEKYCRMVDEAKSFHAEINDKCKIESFACYGNDKSELTLGSIRWLMKAHTHKILTKTQIETALPISSHEGGSTRVARVQGDYFGGQGPILEFQIQAPDAAGDGTVPWQSGGALEEVNLRGKGWPLTGFSHQYACDNESVEIFVVWAICKSVSELNL